MRFILESNYFSLLAIRPSFFLSLSFLSFIQRILIFYYLEINGEQILVARCDIYNCFLVLLQNLELLGTVNGLIYFFQVVFLIEDENSCSIGTTISI